MKNFEIARLFYEMATLLEVRNESVFRVRAWQRGAQTLETLGEDLEAVAARGELLKLPGIGKDLASAIEEYLRTGTVHRLDAMRGGLPPTFVTLLEIRGLGPKTAKALWDELGVDSVDRLEELCEYGVFEEATDRRVAGAREEDVYAAIGLSWVPPELREASGEIEAARAGRLPELVTADDIRGDLHAHTDWSDGQMSLEKLVEAAEARGWEYVIVSDHSRTATIARGLGIEELRAQIQRIRELQPRHRIRILAGTECDVLADGTLDFPDEVLAECDLVLAAVHGRYKQDRETMTRRIVRALEHPAVNVLVHPTGRLIGSRDPYDVDLDRVFATARTHGKALEINASPDRLDLADVHARRAGELGIPIAVSTDAHSVSNLDLLPLGIGVARRAWLTRAHVLNARPIGELLAWAHSGR